MFAILLIKKQLEIAHGAGVKVGAWQQDSPQIFEKLVHRVVHFMQKPKFWIIMDIQWNWNIGRSLIECSIFTSPLQDKCGL